jgi:predicted negative regulator of RcsB-dependent stress response
MTEMRTEEEQIEAIKKWWEENGKQTIVAAVVVVGGWLGYQGYENNVKASAESASAVYQQVLTLTGSEEEADKGQRAVLLDQLQSEYSSTVYAQFASLFKAKDAVEAGDLVLAAAELTSVVSNASDTALQHLATVRLARVMIAQEKLDDALALLNNDNVGAFEAEYAEAKGDALLAKGDTDAAREAYTKGLAAAQRIGANNPILKMKLDDLAVVN